jgi:hypothetical protein
VGIEETRTPDLYRVKLVVLTNTKTYKTLAAIKIPVSRARAGIMCPYCALELGFCALEYPHPRVAGGCLVLSNQRGTRFQGAEVLTFVLECR